MKSHYVKIVDESIFFFSRVFLLKFSLEVSIFCGYKGIYTMKNQFFHNRVDWRFGLATWLSRESKPRTNWMARLDFLSCSATTGMTVQLLCMLHSCASSGGLQAASHPWDLAASPASVHNFEHFFTLSHTLPLHDSHLNIGLLIAKLQANLARNKTNKMVD